MTQTHTLSAFALLVGLSACATMPAPEVEPAAVNLMADCLINIGNNAEREAPTWMCDEPVAEALISAVGSAEGGSQVPVDFLKTQAEAKAMAQLGRQFSATVASHLKSFQSATGSYSDDSYDAFGSSVATVLSEQTLVGAKRLKSREVPINNGNQARVYVLVGIDREDTEKAIRKALDTTAERDRQMWERLRQAKIKTSQGNERARWQKFTAEEAFTEMAKAIAEKIKK